MAKKKFGYGDFFCTNCGERIEKGADVCPRCHLPYDDSKYIGIDPVGAGGVGWSDRADDPVFKKNSKKNFKTSIICMFIVSIGIFAAVYFSSKDREMSTVLPIFGIVMAIIWGFWLIWLIVNNTKRRDWEGVVEGKTCKVQTNTRRDSDGNTQEYTQTIMKIVIRRNDGKIKKLTEIDRSNWYEYLTEGDRVRYHGNHMNYYEKYDKSKDPFIPCASCGLARDSRENYCGKCGAVILKGKPVQRTTGAAPFSQNVRQSAETEPRSARNTGAAYCRYCGTKTNGGKFCRNCGKEV